MDNIKLMIRERYGQMSKGEKRLSDFILENPVRILGMTAADIAEASGVSTASVIRYVKKLGAEGLDRFKLELASSMDPDEGEEWKMADPVLSKEDNLESICEKMQARTESAFKDFFYQLDRQELERAVNMVKSARKLYLLGIGSSYTVAYDLFHKLRRAGFDANCYQDINMVTEFFNYIDDRDVVIAVSYSGQSSEVLYACRQAKEKQAQVIAITRNRDSAIKAMADICLQIPDKEDVRRVGTFESLQASLMMGWLLYLGAIQEDFERIEVEMVNTRKLVEGMKKKND